MTKDVLFDFVSSFFSVEPEYLWEEDTSAVFRHPSSKKWFAIVMDVKKKSLHFDNSDEIVPVLNVKASPLLIEDLLHEEGFLPAYHMNKKHWISILLDSSISDDTIKKMIESSWNSICPKTRK